jgi:hypothetical protein
VPSLLELFTLRHSDGGGIDPEVFVDEDALGAFGSSTPTSDPETHWNLTFPYELSTIRHRVRCVRGPE